MVRLKLQLFAKKNEEEIKPTVTQTQYASNGAKTTIPEIKGVDKSYVETMNSTFKQSEGTTTLQQNKNKDAQAYREYASNTDIVGADIYAGMSTPYSKSASVLQAEQLLQSKIDKGYAGTYKESLNNLINDFMNRESFEYDVDKDQMFQQALASAMGSGKTAMQDTMGQAAALTGGYGSTYATSAGNQAYNAFIEDAYNNLPEYYNMALAAYEAEGQQMLQQYNMLDSADTKEYNQWYDDINLQYRSTRDMVNDEYNQWNANQTMYTNLANTKLAENAQIGNNLYNMYNISSNEYENAYAKEWDNWQQSVDSAYKMAGLQNSDYWSTEELNFKKSEAERDQGNIDRNYNFQVSEAERDQKNNDRDFAFKESEAKRDQSNWQSNFNYKKEQDKQTQSNWQSNFNYQKEQDKQSQSNWEKNYALDLAQAGATFDKNGNVIIQNNKNGNNNNTPWTDDDYKKVVKAFETNGGVGAQEQIDILGQQNNWDEKTAAKLYSMVVPALSTWEAGKDAKGNVQDGGWKIGKVDDDAVIVDTVTGKRYTGTQLYDLYIKSGKTKSEARKLVQAAQKMAGVQ